MGQVLIQGLDDEILEKIRRRAEGNHRSLEAELQEIIDAASMQVDMATAARRNGSCRSRMRAKPSC